MAEFQSLMAAFRVAHFVPVREILASGSQAYRDLIPRDGGAAATEFRHWFLTNARRFDGSGDGSTPAEVRAFLSRCGRQHEDAFLAAQTFAQEDGSVYWEGYAVPAALPVRVAVHHAWNTVDGALVDLAWSGGNAHGNVYLGVPVAHAVLRRLQTELATGGHFYRGPLAFLSWAVQRPDGQPSASGVAPGLPAADYLATTRT